MIRTVVAVTALLLVGGCGVKPAQPGAAKPTNPPAATTTYSEEQFKHDVEAEGWQDIPPSNNGGYASALQFCNEAKQAQNEEPLKRFRAQLESGPHHTKAQLDAYIRITKKTCGLA